ncbi:MAG: TonB-dependent receptor domain-containing protein [Chitinophagales bacterium]
MRISLSYLFILLFLNSTLMAQDPNGEIRGTVRDSNENSLQGVTIALLNENDSSLVKMAVTNTDGSFSFEKIKEGKFLLSASAIGYKTWVSESVQVSPSHSPVRIPEIKLESLSVSMGAVTVTGKRPMIENKIDKTVVNVDASLTNAGNSAMDVLEKSPYITIDKDGNINLKGKQGVTIMIDGKQTYLGGQDLVNLLKNMPASQLDQVEIMTQPSAKYDAAGNSGIINLKTKRNLQKGFNGSITLNYVQGIYPKFPNSLTFNYRNRKFNFFGNYSYSYWEGFSDIAINRFIVDQSKGTNTHFQQTSNFHFVSNTQNFKAGVDYFADNKNTFGVSVSGLFDNRRTWVSTISNLYDLDQNGVLGSYSTANTQTQNPWNNIGLNANYRRQINRNGKELSADFDYIYYNTRSIQQSDNYNYNPDGSLDSSSGTINPYLLRGNLPSIIKIYTGKVDYTHPLNDKAKIEAGWKSSWVRTDNDAQYTYLVNNISYPDTGRSNRFIYEENINALYTNYSQTMGKWSVQAGLRMEQTEAKGTQTVKDQRFDTSYIQLFPSVFLSYSPNDKNSYSLTYGRRIDRPNYQDMNPFQYFLDQYTYRQGNPNLRPQFSHNVEFSYNFKGELNLSANYTLITDVINDILKQNDSTKVTYQTKENVANQTNIGLSFSYSKQWNNWWNLSLSGNVSNNHYTGIVNNAYLDVSMTSFEVNLTTQFKFKKGWSAEANGFYNSKALWSGLIVAEPMENISFAVAKQILKDKGTLKLNLRDPFYIMHFSGYTKFSNIDFNVLNHWDNRRIGLTFTYRFGKTANAGPQRKRGGSSEEQGRVGAGANQQ